MEPSLNLFIPSCWPTNLYRRYRCRRCLPWHVDELPLTRTVLSLTKTMLPWMNINTYSMFPFISDCENFQFSSIKLSVKISKFKLSINQEGLSYSTNTLPFSRNYKTKPQTRANALNKWTWISFPLELNFHGYNSCLCLTDKAIEAFFMRAVWLG